MPRFVDWLITLLVVTMVATYIWYLASLRRQPAQHRPRTPVYDRYGRSVDMRENPDYHVMPSDKPDDSTEAPEKPATGDGSQGPPHSPSTE